MNMKQPSRTVTLIVTVLTGLSLVFGMGCYGNFSLTRAVHRVNDTPGNDLVDNVVFWVFVIVPVYEVAILADAVVLNLLEFWLNGSVRFTDGAGTEQSGYVLRSAGPDRAHLIKTGAEDDAVRATFVRVSDGRCDVRGPGGKLLGRARRSGDGDIRLEDRRGRCVRTLDAERVRARLQPE